MKLNSFLKAILEKAGIDLNDAEVKKVLDNEQLASIDLVDDHANKAQEALMTLAAAENNPVLRDKLIKKGRAEAYGGMDDELAATMDDLGIDDDLREKILAEKSTTKRARMLATEVKRIEKEKGGKKGDDGEAEKLKGTVNELNRKISEMQKAHEKALEDEAQKYAEKLLNKDIESDLLGFRYIFPEKTPAATKIAAARTSVNAALAAAGAKVIIDDAGNKKLVRIDGTDYYDAQNKSVAYHDFVTAALTADNLLDTSAPKNPGEYQPPVPPKEPEPGNKVNASYAQQASDDLAQLEASLKDQ